MTQHPAHAEGRLSYRDILLQQIVEGMGELRRPAAGLLLSGLSAGLDVGFSVLLMAVMLTTVGGHLSPGVVEILLANLYAVGFIFVILGRSELFTEHTTLAVFPVLQRKAGVGALARLWALVYVSNLAGAAIFALMASQVGPALGVASTEAFEELGARVVDHSATTIVLSAILAGWMMGLVSWLVTAATDTIGRIVIVWLVTAGIGFAHLHHSIVGTVEVLAAVWSGGDVTWADYGHFIVWTTLGNAVGGVFFVALIKFSHSVQPGREAEDHEVEETARQLDPESDEPGAWESSDRP